MGALVTAVMMARLVPLPTLTICSSMISASSTRLSCSGVNRASTCCLSMFSCLVVSCPFSCWIRLSCSGVNRAFTWSPTVEME